MARALSLDLRERVIAAIETDASCVQAAERFGVGKASAIRWHARYRSEGEIAAKPMGGDRHSRRTEAHAAADPESATRLRPQIYLREVKDALEENGATASLSGLSGFFRRHGVTRKKGDLHAAEQNRSGCDGGARSVVRGPTRPRPRACRLPG